MITISGDLIHEIFSNSTSLDIRVKHYWGTILPIIHDTINRIRNDQY